MAVGPLTDLEREVTALVERIAPSVVSVRVAARGGGKPREGTGFIWDARGHIVTTADVAQNATGVLVVLKDGRELPAGVVGVDVLSNLALLRLAETVKPSFLPVVIGDSAKVRVGNWAITIGNLVGLDHSVALGVVSGTNRVAMSGTRNFTSLLQITGTLGPGASGGPVFNASGEIIGVMTAAIGYPGNPGDPRNGSSVVDSSGLATPIHIALPLLEDLRQHRRVLRPWIGVLLTPAAEGLLISQVAEPSPAQEAGLEPGDLIVSVNGKPLYAGQNNIALPTTMKAGDGLLLNVRRASRTLSAKITLGPRPSTLPVRWITLTDEASLVRARQRNKDKP